MLCSGQFIPGRDRSAGRCVYTSNKLEGASGVLQLGFRGQRVWLAPRVDVTGARLSSVPGEDFLCLSITFWHLQAQQFWGQTAQYQVAPGGPRPLGLVSGISPRHCPGCNFSEERGKQEASPSRTEAWALGFLPQPGFSPTAFRRYHGAGRYGQ